MSKVPVPVEFETGSVQSDYSSSESNILSKGKTMKLFPLHEAAFMGNAIEVEKLLSSRDASSYVQQLNSHTRTPLHECGRGDDGPNTIKIAQKLLTFIPEESLEQYLNKKDEDNVTAFYYAVQNSNVNLVEFLLETEAKLKSKGTSSAEPEEIQVTEEGTKSLLRLATENGSLETFKLLLKYGHKIKQNEHGILLRAAVRDRNSTSHIEIFKYILEIIKENDDDMDDLQETDMQLKYILHYASKRCNLEILKILLKPEFGDDFPLLRRKKDLTPIHYALKSWNDENFFDAARLLVSKCFDNYDGFVLYDELYSAKDSPLNFAFGLMNTNNAPFYVVGVLLENVQTKFECWERLRLNEDIISRIYDKAPDILTKMINQSVKLVNLETVDIDFGLIFPVQEKPTYFDATKTSQDETNSTEVNGQPETRYLRKILGKNNSIQKSILMHPIVKLYLELKYKSFYAFNLFCCFIQIVFLAAYTYLIPMKYSIDEEDPNESNETGSALNNKEDAIEVGKSQTSPENPTAAVAGSSEEEVFQQQSQIFLLAIIIFIAYIIPMTIKEVWQIASYRFNYFSSLTRWIQLINLVCVGIVCVECLRDVTNLYPVAAVSGLLSWVLFLRELSKIFTECNIWTSALVKVVKRSIKLAIYFFPLLMGFYLVFRVLIPWRNFHYWLGGLGRMLVLMTGEFEYEDTFNGDKKPSEGRLLLGTMSFMLFVMVTVISLSNLLVAVAVEDISKLRKDAEFKSLASRLEYMYGVEIIYFRLCKIQPIRLIMNSYGFVFKKISKMIVAIWNSVRSSESRKRNISNISMEIPIDGMLSIPRNLFSEEELRDLNLL